MDMGLPQLQPLWDQDGGVLRDATPSHTWAGWAADPGPSKEGTDQPWPLLPRSPPVARLKIYESARG